MGASQQLRRRRSGSFPATDQEEEWELPNYCPGGGVGASQQLLRLTRRYAHRQNGAQMARIVPTLEPQRWLGRKVGKSSSERRAVKPSTSSPARLWFLQTSSRRILKENPAPRSLTGKNARAFRTNPVRFYSREVIAESCREQLRRSSLKSWDRPQGGNCPRDPGGPFGPQGGTSSLRSLNELASLVRASLPSKLRERYDS